MNSVQHTARVGLLFLLGLALIWVTYEALGSKSVLSKTGYPLVAGFQNLKALKQGDDVRMAGVRIGAVETTQLAGHRVEAILRIDKKVSIPSDARATITSSGLLGTNYVAITLGTPLATPLGPDSEIRTYESADLGTVMTQLSELGEKLEDTLGAVGGAFRSQDGQPSLFERLNQFLSENGSKIDTVMGNLEAITSKVNQGEGTLGKLVNDPAVYDQLLTTIAEIQAAAGEARSFVTGAQELVAHVKTGHGTLGTLLYDEKTTADLKAMMANFAQVSEKLAKGEGTLGKLINDDTLYTDAQATLQKADRALGAMGDSGPITAVGAVANALF